MDIEHPGRARQDARIPVNTTTVFPYWCIGQLTMQFANGDVYNGTGTLIDDRHVLTCAHNLYGGDTGPATAVSFSRGRNGMTNPYGEIAATHYVFPEEYRHLAPPNPDSRDLEVTEQLYDFALVKLAEEVPITRVPQLEYVDDDLFEQTGCLIIGYPGDKPAGTMWQSQGEVRTEPRDEFLFYEVPTAPGLSGSAVMVRSEQRRNYVIGGVHVARARIGEAASSFAVRMNELVIQEIVGWADSNSGWHRL
jgi:V8-like Glu-specific endopeptidase